MLQNKFEMPLDLKVEPSKIFTYYICFISLLSLVSVYLSSLSMAGQLLLVTSLGLFVAFTFNGNKKNRVIALSLNSNDGWGIELSNNERLCAVLQGECIVTYYIVWLNFIATNSLGKKTKHHLFLLPDSANKQQLRKLRVRLRFLKNEKLEAKEKALTN